MNFGNDIYRGRASCARVPARTFAGCGRECL